MYYVSYTRLKLEGTVAGRKVQGEAWMDHQWGDQQSGASALWDWFGLQLSDDSDVMLYRVKDPKGAVVQLVGSLIRPDGKIESLRNLEMTPLQSWPSPAGYSYSVAWRIASEQFSTTLQPLRLDQELLTRSTHVAYWEGPVAGKGSLGGKAVDVKGMGEFVGGVYNP